MLKYNSFHPLISLFCNIYIMLSTHLYVSLSCCFFPSRCAQTRCVRLLHSVCTLTELKMFIQKLQLLICLNISWRTLVWRLFCRGNDHQILEQTYWTHYERLGYLMLSEPCQLCTLFSCCFASILNPFSSWWLIKCLIILSFSKWLLFFYLLLCFSLRSSNVYNSFTTLRIRLKCLMLSYPICLNLAPYFASSRPVMDGT